MHNYVGTHNRQGGGKNKYLSGKQIKYSTVYMCIVCRLGGAL